METAWQDVRRGSPLDEVVKRCDGVKHVVLIVLEGCRADHLEGALRGGDLPNLARMMEELGHLRYRQCTSVFPSVTVPAHTSLVTGAWPGEHDVLGNEWFQRENWGQTPIKQRRPLRHETREYIKYSVMDPGADPGLANALLATGGYFGLPNADLGRSRTLYEAYNLHRRGRVDSIRDHWLEETVALLEPISRGADHSVRLRREDLSVILKGLVWGIPSGLMGHLERRQFLDLENQGFDYLAMGGLLDHLTRDKVPAVTTVWLPGLDGYSHRSGARQQRKYFRRGRLDHMFGRLHATIQERGLAEEILVCLVAGHGHYDAEAKRESRLREEDIYQHLRSAAGKGQIFPLTPKGRYSLGNRDATVVATLNGGSLFLYLKGEDSRNRGDGWLNRPSEADLKTVCKAMERHKAADKIFAYHAAEGYRQWWKDSFVDLGDWPVGDEYPMARERLMGLAGSGRSPDVVVSAASTYYFARQTCQGEHGSLRREDSHVPLLFMSGRLPRKEEAVSGWVSICDVAPTLAQVLGCREELEGSQDDGERLRALLGCLEEFRSGGGRDQWFDFGRALGSPVDKMFGSGFTRNKAEADYRATLEAVSEGLAYSAERFRSHGSISEDLYLGVKDAVKSKQAHATRPEADSKDEEE